MIENQIHCINEVYENPTQNPVDFSIPEDVFFL